MSNQRTRPGGQKAPPWFRLYGSDFLARTAGMKALDKGVYVVVLCDMNERRGPIPEDHSRLARMAGTTAPSIKAALGNLIEAGLVFRTASGLLWSQAAQSEIENQEKRSELARKKSSIRWDNIEQNQRSDDAAACRGIEDRYIDPQAPGGPEESYTSHSPQGGDVPARDGAGHDPVCVNQRVEIAGLGVCYVDKIVSTRPFQFLVYQSDQSGEQRAYRVSSNKRQYFEISLDEADDLPDLSDEADNDRTA